MLRGKSKQQNTRPNRTYFINDKNSLKMHGILWVRRLAHKSTITEFATVTGDETGRTTRQLIDYYPDSDETSATSLRLT